MADCFLDTNVLLYAVSTEPAEADKTRIARGLLQSADWALVGASRRGIRPGEHLAPPAKPLTRVEARRWVETWMAFPMAPIDGPTVLEAVQLAEQFQISHFDAQILVTAKRMGCAIVYSEDLSHGQDYGGVRIMNPFIPQT